MAVFSDLKGLIEQSGVTAAYDFRPIWRQDNESAGNEGQRYIVMRRTGGASDKFVRRANYGVQVLGKVQDRGIAGLESDADAIVKHLTNAIDFNCIAGTNINGDIAGVYFTDSNRPFFLFDIEVIYNA